MNKQIYAIGLSLIGIIFGLFLYTRLDYEMTEAKSESVYISFEQLDSQISEVSCFTFNYPVNNKVVTNLKLKPEIEVPNGVLKPILCEAKVGEEIFPIFWQSPGKNMSGQTLLSRAIFANTPQILINKLAVVLNSKQIIAYSSKSDLVNLDSLMDFKGEYKLTSLKKFPLDSHAGLCSFCDEKLKENGTVFIDQYNLDKESFIDSAILNFWYSKNNYLNCGSVSGFSHDFLKSFGLSAHKDTHLSEFIWSDNLKDGWEDSQAKATRKLLDCNFNDAAEQWQCNKNENNSSKVLLEEGQPCSATSNIAAQQECKLLYFNEHYKASNCVNKVFYNIGQEPRVTLQIAPSSKGMSFSQRVVFLTNDTFSFNTSFIYSQPIFKNKVNYPCKILVELSGVFKKDTKGDVLTYAELRSINSDHKSVCEGSVVDKYKIKTFILGKKI